MNYLFPFQFCLNFGNLCIYRDVLSTLKIAVAAVCFCLIHSWVCRARGLKITNNHGEKIIVNFVYKF